MDKYHEYALKMRHASWQELYDVVRKIWLDMELDDVEGKYLCYLAFELLHDKFSRKMGELGEK